MYTYVAAKKAAIIFRISASPFVVSSNPGISIRVTVLSSRVNGAASLTSAVHDSEPIPIRRLEPLARLINWRVSDELLDIISGCIRPTVVFPLPVAPMTLWRRLG